MTIPRDGLGTLLPCGRQVRKSERGTTLGRREPVGSLPTEGQDHPEVESKKRQIPRILMQRAVRKVWKLYFQSETSGLLPDKEIYQRYRADAERVIKQGPPEWKRIFVLP